MKHVFQLENHVGQDVRKWKSTSPSRLSNISIIIVIISHVFVVYVVVVVVVVEPCAGKD